MKTWTAPASISVLVVCMLAQQSSRPQLKLRIIVDKEIYALHERVMVKSELTNLTTKTLCFPVPDQDCETTGIGSIITTGDPVNAGEVDRFICHAERRRMGGGARIGNKESLDPVASECGLHDEDRRGHGKSESGWRLATQGLLPSAGGCIQSRLREDPAIRCRKCRLQAT
jgi:hypothetical protein